MSIKINKILSSNLQLLDSDDGDVALYELSSNNIVDIGKLSRDSEFTYLVKYPVIVDLVKNIYENHTLIGEYHKDSKINVLKEGLYTVTTNGILKLYNSSKEITIPYKDVVSIECIDDLINVGTKDGMYRLCTIDFTLIDKSTYIKIYKNNKYVISKKKKLLAMEMVNGNQYLLKTMYTVNGGNMSLYGDYLLTISPTISYIYKYVSGEYSRIRGVKGDITYINDYLFIIDKTLTIDGSMLEVSLVSYKIYDSYILTDNGETINLYNKHGLVCKIPIKVPFDKVYIYDDNLLYEKYGHLYKLMSNTLVCENIETHRYLGCNYLEVNNGVIEDIVRL